MVSFKKDKSIGFPGCHDSLFRELPPEQVESGFCEATTSSDLDVCAQTRNSGLGHIQRNFDESPQTASQSKDNWGFVFFCC